jgi:hypothetical protein
LPEADAVGVVVVTRGGDAVGRGAVAVDGYRRQPALGVVLEVLGFQNGTSGGAALIDRLDRPVAAVRLARPTVC